MLRIRAGVCHVCVLLSLSGGCDAFDGPGDSDGGFDRTQNTSNAVPPGIPQRMAVDPTRPTTPSFEPEPDPIFEPPILPSSQVMTQPAMLELFAGGQPPEHAFVPREGWPAVDVDAEPVDAELVGSSCSHDGRGNWVCLWSPGTGMSAGPCDFDSDGALVASAQVVWPDFRALPQADWPDSWETSAVVVRHRADGELDWARAWHRAEMTPALQLAVWGLVVGDDGSVTWGGEICQLDSGLPPAADGGYASSCIDGYLSSVDARGEPLWSWSFGTTAGLERVSDMRAAPDGGLYVAGTFHAPLQLPGHPDLASTGGSDFMVMRLDADRSVRWAHTWGSADHDGNGVRIGVSSAGALALSSNPGLDAPSHDGMLAVLDADGQLRWERRGLDLYITHVALDGDEAIAQIGPQLVRVGATGEPREMTGAPGAPGATGVAKLRFTPEGHLLVASANGGAITELDPEGGILRSLSFAGTDGLWYHGGLCVGPGGEVGISGRVSGATDFGILDEPIELPAPAGFVLMLRDW